MPLHLSTSGNTMHFNRLDTHTIRYCSETVAFDLEYQGQLDT